MKKIIQAELDSNPMIYEACMAIEDLKMYVAFLANPVLYQIPIYDLMYHEIIPSLNALIQEKGEEPRRLTYFQTHHEIVAPMLYMFGFDDVILTNPADSVSFMFMQKSK